MSDGPLSRQNKEKEISMATTGSGRIEVREGGAFHGEFHLSDGTEVECVGSVGASSLPAFETSEASITYENAPEGATFLTGGSWPGRH
ncbi:hypothetical protein GCM10020295_56530 [Streptomyces cinereospinus]